MTTTDTVFPATGATPSWWAPAATLRERLSAPHPPAAPAAGPAAGARTRSAVEPACQSARSARLGADARLMAALAVEPPARLAGRLAKPQWAEFVEDAVADAADGAAVFEPVLRPLVAAAVAELLEQAGAGGAEPGEAAVFAREYARWLARRLAKAAARTLVVELAAARAAGDLSGTTAAARFADFAARAGTRAGLARLFAGYPVLARLLARTCRHTARSGAELLARLAADRRELADELFGGRDPGPLAAAELGLGDLHQQGRSVAVLRFAGGGSAVYKPRPVDQHALLDRMAGWLGAEVPGLELRTPLWVAGDGYGWLEYIDHRTCRSLTEIDRFHRRQGALIALAHTLEGVDLHYENLLAHGDQPVLVDVETLLHPVLREGGTTRPDPAAEAHASSVHRTCLLPQLLMGELGAVDVSALGGAPGGESPNTRMVWEDAGTDEMRLVRRPVPFTGALNRPYSAATGPESADRLAAVLAGFRAGYDAVVRHRDELSGPAGLLAAGADAVGRLVVRPTMLYATLLEEATHPQVLRDGLDRDAMFAVLWAESDGDPARQALIEYEIADLWDGDVPVFFHRPGSPEVLASDGSPVNGVLDMTGLASAQAKLAAMGAVDRHAQEWIISATLASTEPGTAGRHHRVDRRARPAPAALPEPSALLAAASGVADEIAGRAVRGHGRVNWIGLEAVDDRWTVLPMGAGLAQGYSGVALFLAQLGALTGSARHTELARAALAPVPELVAAMAADPALSRAVGPGGFEGLGGVCYALARVATLVDDDLAECLPTALDALALAALGDDTPPDVSAGLAGALAALHAVHRERGLPQAADLADRIAERLLRLPPAARPGDEAPERFGFAFGEAGIGWALARHARFAGGPLGARADAAGRARLTTALAATDRLDAGWCSGTAGVVLAAADAGLCPQSAQGPARDASRRLTEHPPVADLSLCHGELGIAEAVAALAGHGHIEARGSLTGRTGPVLGLLHAWGPRCGTPGRTATPGLLTGLSGIGYALLRLGFADTVPSVLLLDSAQGGGWS
ncbi:lanthionine synthetase [Streptomyces minutiscleroticus]|uniref:Lanthionine synthetase n=1 Tax=Streptomyces minutiscleroticus TaxID=68238 RepID=A0A918NSE2_9ACTN|nr:type 2 lanthipeptide synthetase LanM family protein [Streptomyces minutiscleroticus]GGX92238.1 lanthionine synthetase [Streptomyces minutiscleroticus]